MKFGQSILPGDAFSLLETVVSYDGLGVILFICFGDSAVTPMGESRWLSPNWFSVEISRGKMEQARVKNIK